MRNQSEEDSINEKTPKFISFSFFIFGISCLCAWNAIISSLDFFIFFVIFYIYLIAKRVLPLLHLPTGKHSLQSPYDNFPSLLQLLLL